MTMELLAPAGGEAAAYVALDAGADAVYLGMKQFSARSSAENFDVSALSRVTKYAHLLGAKVYVALNTLVKDGELSEFFGAAEAAWSAGADAILLQDLFLGRELKRRCPALTLHLSTQAGCCNVYGAEVARDYGFSRAVLARETPISEVEKISRILETEVFVQGALCTAFSGQCFFSSFAGGNSGNRGKCKQPCRKKYSIDRSGFDALSYALSTSDLCLGKRLDALKDAGVVSLKIEGRMRREEYVAAAVSYYRARLAGREGKEEFSALARAYNRGDYTEGLMFGQKEDFLSRDVQGHIGVRVGLVKIDGGTPVCRTSFAAKKGDCFKILRGGKEVCGAYFSKTQTGGFALSAEKKLLAGDEVRLTSRQDPSLPARRLRPIAVRLEMKAGAPAKAYCGDLCYTGEVLPAAEKAPLSEEDFRAAFLRVDGLPLAPQIEVETDGVFFARSALNAFRRGFYAALCAHLCPKREEKLRTALPPLPNTAENSRVARIVDGQTCDMGAENELIIVKQRDLKVPVRGKYLYLPPFLTSEEIAAIDPREIAGVFGEGYYAIALAKKWGVPLFAGTGFHIANRIAVSAVREVAQYFTLSKELSRTEQDVLAAEGAFALTAGDIKLMDLIYCPFEKTCAACSRREFYSMRDEAGRIFPLRRYLSPTGACRFEVYNCAALLTEAGTAGRLYDDSALAVRPHATTKGHAERSVL